MSKNNNCKVRISRRANYYENPTHLKKDVEYLLEGVEFMSIREALENIKWLCYRNETRINAIRKICDLFLDKKVIK